ncbi:MAG: HAD hydrolase family protein, partial [Thermodesulfobacteriota bacterium]
LNKTVDENLVRKKALELGIDCVRGGRFLHLFCGGDKGKAVDVILDLYQEQGGSVISIGIGDGQNDLPMLWAVDKAVVMETQGGGYHEDLDRADFMKAGGRGPGAWNKVMLRILEDLLA